MLVTQHPVFRRFWYPVIPLDRLAAGPQPFTLLGTKIVLWLDGEGQPAAARDRCCHRTAMLSRGFCENGNIVCGYHGWTFDRAGKCVRVPQFDAARKLNFSVPAYRCTARYGYAWVALEEPLYDIPDVPEASDPAFRCIHEFYEEWNTSGMRFMENSFDYAHLAFTHRASFGTQADLTGVTTEIQPFDGGFRLRAESLVSNPEIQKKNLRLESDVTTRQRNNAYWLPFNMRLGITYQNGLRHTIMSIMTPVDDTHSVLVQFCYRNDTEADAKTADIVAFDRQVTLEDKYILEATEADVRLADYGSVEKSMATDRPGLLIRRMLHELLVRHGEAVVATEVADAVTVE
jgi:phenylpropionate dioxygenase-like ring-hydroxylating dioxygenase large terminal subunit